MGEGGGGTYGWERGVEGIRLGLSLEIRREDRWEIVQFRFDSRLHHQTNQPLPHNTKTVTHLAATTA